MTLATTIVEGGYPAPTGFIVEAQGRFGRLASEIPAGTDDVSPLANDGILTGDQYLWTLTSLPASGTVDATDEGAFTHSGAADGTYPTGYSVYILRAADDSLDIQTNTISTTFGAGASFSATMSGGLQAGGGFTSSFSRDYAHTTSGGAQAGGAFTSIFSRDYAHTLAGGAQTGGAFGASAGSDFAHALTGGATLGGTADTVVGAFGYAMQGGVVAGGAVTAASTADYTFTMSDGLVLSGDMNASLFVPGAASGPGARWMRLRRRSNNGI